MNYDVPFVPDSQSCSSNAQCASGSCRLTCCDTAFVGCAICSSDFPQTDCALPTITNFDWDWADYVHWTEGFAPAGGDVKTFSIHGDNLCEDQYVGYAYVRGLTFGVTGVENSITDAPTGCICTDFRTITCTAVTIPAGQGVDLLYTLTVGASATSDAAALRSVTSTLATPSDDSHYYGGTMYYTAPSVVSISGPLSTFAPGNFTITGSGFGAAAGGSIVQAVSVGGDPTGTDPLGAYFFQMSNPSTACVVTSDTLITCTNAVMPGQGAGLNVRLTLGPTLANGVSSDPTAWNKAASYAAPVISGLLSLAGS
jgi:hypothetical protein